jgi:ATP-dependent RNA helicase DOB1
MSGRAGRRGKDERGICVIMIDEKVKVHCSMSLLSLFFKYNS